MTNRYLPTRIKLLIASLAILISFSHAFSQDAEWSINRSPLPEPTGFVNDYAGVIDAPTKAALEAKLKTLKQTTNPSVEIAVAVVRTTGDRAISEYSIAVARGWKIGSKEQDNPSALLFIAIDDRKYFTQVSKDLEDELPDGLVGSLQRQYLVPEFRKGNYGKGISDTIDAYIATINGKATGTAPTPKPELQRERTSTGGFPIFGIFCCGIIIIVILVIIFSNRKGGPGGSDRDRWGGGGFGGGGDAGSNIASAVIGGIIGSALSGGSSSGSSSDWGGSSGGSDWGGFGGGGDFGGGGAGGDW